jgi:hypothetical protein
MHPDSRHRTPGGKDSARRNLFHLLVLAVWPLASAGCEEEPRQVDRKTAASVQPKKESGGIIGKRTQKVIEAAPALETGKAKVASTKIKAKDPITLVGNAYVSIVGRSTMLSIEHSLDIFHANNDRYPKDLAEFMAEIIKANNIGLPVLPPYQEYAYDEKEHKLIVLEYPDRK